MKVTLPERPALLETGMVAMTEPETVVRLDAGRWAGDRCERVHLDMVPALVEALDLEIATDTWGPGAGEIG